MENAKKNGMFLTIMCLSLYIIQGTPSAMSPAIASFAAHFPEYSLSTIMLVATLPPIVAVIGNLALGPFSKAVGMKKALIVSFIIYFIGGIMPAFTFSSFAMVLVGRAIMGLGYGLVYPACATMIVNVIEQSKRGSLMGIGSTIATVAGIAFSMLSGVLLGVSINGVFWVHLIAVIPFVIILFCPAKYMETSTEAASAGSKADNAPAEKVKFGGKSWFWQISAAVMLVFYYVTSLYISLVVADLGGVATQSSLASSVGMVAGAVAGLIFGKTLSVLGKYLVPVSSAITAAGFVLVFIAKGLPLVFVGMFLCGFGYKFLVPYVFMMIATTTPSTKIASANGNAAAFMNVAGFVCPYIFSFVTGAIGMQTMQSVFGISAVFFAAQAIAFIFIGDKLSKA